jgi:hypothetical protein
MGYRFRRELQDPSSGGSVSTWESAFASPKKWQLHASNDGTNWTILDEQDNREIIIGEGHYLFEIPNRTLYRHYEFTIEEAIAGTFINLTELTPSIFV